MTIGSTRWHRLRPLLGTALLLAGLVAPAQAQMTAHETALHAAARKEGSLNWYVSHYDAEAADKAGDAFAARYPGVKVNTTRTTAQVAFQRISAEMKSGAIQVDVLSSSDPGHYVFLKSRGALVQYVPENDAKILEPFRRYDPDGYFHVTYAGGVGMAVNTEKVAPADDPKTWQDLLDPKWKGRIANGHPGFSGAVGVWAVTVRKLYGPAYLKGLEAQKPLIGRSINDAPTILQSGERHLALVQLSTAAKLAERGAPLRLIYPEDGAVLIVGPSGIVKGGKSPNAARLFMEFLQSVEMSEIVRLTYREPLRPEVAGVPGMRPLSEMKLIQPTVDEIEKGVPEVKEEWRELFGN